MSLRQKLFENTENQSASKILHVSDFNQNIPRLKELVHALNIFINSVNPYGDRQDVFGKYNAKKDGLFKVTEKDLSSSVHTEFCNNNSLNIIRLSTKERCVLEDEFSQTIGPEFNTEYREDGFVREYEFHKLKDGKSFASFHINEVRKEVMLSFSQGSFGNEQGLTLDLTKGTVYKSKTGPHSVTEGEIGEFINNFNNANALIKENILDKVQIQPAKQLKTR